MPSQTSKRLPEVDLKCLYLEHVRRLGVIDCESVIASEYFIGQTGRRADLAIMSGEFIGVEIKSRTDSLKRLQAQLDAYLRCFDRVVLIADERHIPKAKAQIPASVELWSVNGVGELTLVQKPTAAGCQSARVLAQLCTTRQLRRLVSADKTSLSRSKLINIVMHQPFDCIHEAATAAFKEAFGRSSAAFWSELGGRDIEFGMLAPLSRFAETRLKKESARRDQREFWSTWAEEAAAVFGTPQQQCAAAS